MEKIFYLNSLYDLYKELFTEKQQMYFEAYYFENLSLAEIAENNDVSRNAIHNQIKIMEDKLEELESKLHLLKKKETIIKKLENKIDKELLEEIKELI